MLGKEECRDGVGEGDEENTNNSSSSSSPSCTPRVVGNNLLFDRYATHSLSFHGDVFDDDGIDDALPPCYSACMFILSPSAHSFHLHI